MLARRLLVVVLDKASSDLPIAVAGMAVEVDRCTGSEFVVWLPVVAVVAAGVAAVDCAAA